MPEDSIPLECGLSRRQIGLLHEAISIVNERRRKAPATTPALSRKKLRALLGPDPITLLLRLRGELRLLNTPLDLAYLEASGLVIRDADDWFRVPDIWKLPLSAAHRIIEAEADCISPRVRFATFRLRAEYEEMEQFVKEANLDALPPPPPLEVSRPEPSRDDDDGARRTEKGDRIWVRGSDGRGWFPVTVTGVDRCRCGAIIVWGRTENGKKIPLNPWPLGADETRSHFKACFRRRKPWGWPAS
jgi:hypothetical protein